MSSESIGDVLIPIVAISLSLAIPIVAIIAEYYRRRDKMKVIEKAIEKGVPLEGLMWPEAKKPRLPYRSGMIATATGLGVVVFGLILGTIDEEATAALAGMGAIAVFIGVALLINDKMNYRRYFENKEP